jgi:hypothetical protein
MQRVDCPRIVRRGVVRLFHSVTFWVYGARNTSSRIARASQAGSGERGYARWFCAQLARGKHDE